MFVGILFTVVVSLVIGTFSALTFFAHYRVNPRFAAQSITAYALFWLGMAGTWYATAGVDFFQYLGELPAAIIMTYTLQVFVGASLVVVAYFFEEALFASRRRTSVLVVYGAWCVLFLISLFWYRVHPQSESFFVGQILPSWATILLFSIAFIPLWLGAIALFLRSTVRTIGPPDPMRRFHVLASIALILIGIAGALDEMGIVRGWMVTAARLVTLVASIIAFTGMNGLWEPDDKVVY